MGSEIVRDELVRKRKNERSKTVGKMRTRKSKRVKERGPSFLGHLFCRPSCLIKYFVMFKTDSII